MEKSKRVLALSYSYPKIPVMETVTYFNLSVLSGEHFIAIKEVCSASSLICAFVLLVHKLAIVDDA